MLVLVRHGEATANAAGLLLGRADVALSPRGLEQVAALRASVPAADALVSSPLSRALDTARGLGLGVDVTVDDRWTELDYGLYDCVAPGDVAPEIWRSWRADPDFRPPRGESLRELSARVVDACEELFAPSGPARDATVVVVSHTSPIKAAAAWTVGAGPTSVWRMYLATGSITRIAWRDAPVLHSFNESP